MTDESLRGDELVSACLDGEASPEEVAEVEQDAVLVARVEQLQAVRDAVAAPVPTMSEKRRDAMISAALAVASEAADQGGEAEIVPVYRRRGALLAVAAAAMLVAAVVSAGLIADRGGDDAEMAADAPAAFDAATEAAPGAALQAPAGAEAMTAADSADHETAREEYTAEADTAEAAPAPADTAPRDAPAEAAPAPADTAEATTAPRDTATTDTETTPAEPESATQEPTERAFSPGGPTADAAETDTAGANESERVVDLGAVADLESLFTNIAPIWSAAPDDRAPGAPGACSAAVNEQAFMTDFKSRFFFVATVGTENPTVFDGLYARRADGTAVIAYAAPPGCAVRIREVGGSGGS